METGSRVCPVLRASVGEHYAVPRTYTLCTPNPEEKMLDTLSIARNLAAAGFEQKQAEAQAEAIAQAVEQKQGETASKADVAALKASIDALKWITGINLAITLALLGVVLAG